MRRKNSYLFEDITLNYSYCKRNLEYLKPIVYKRFYHYGDHFRNVDKPNIQDLFISLILYVYVLLLSSFQALFPNKKEKDVILSSSYFDFDNLISSSGKFRISRPPWKYNLSFSNLFNLKVFKLCRSIELDNRHANLEFLLSQEYALKIDKLKFYFQRYLVENRVKYVILAQDEGFFEQILIDIARDVGIITVANVHGLQFYLNPKSWSRTDYLFVWGELSKSDFVKNGFNTERIIITGHPGIKEKIKFLEPKFSFDDILIITTSLNGIRPNDDLILGDRSNLIYYLRIIQRVLLKFSVKKVRVRLHPSESQTFYQKNIDGNFFHFDTESLQESLKNSTLVIGPTSTMFLDSFRAGVYYLIFNPEINGECLNGFESPSMYNGDNLKVPVAKTVAEFEELLKLGAITDISILNDIGCQSFDLSTVNNILR